MATIVCRKIDCPYNTSNCFCSKLTMEVNQLGQCLEYYAKNGQPRQVLDYFKQEVQMNPFAIDNEEVIEVNGE